MIALTLFLPLVRRWPELVWAGVLAECWTFLFVHGFKHSLAVPRPASLGQSSFTSSVGFC
ncbi:MAG: hypothetical protein IPK09_00035 [Candidatus Competibacteraceae bacterium]|nr:hypothetical protein [Candidatus Competibacteraceae bacterium]